MIKKIDDINTLLKYDGCMHYTLNQLNSMFEKNHVFFGYYDEFNTLISYAIFLDLSLEYELIYIEVNNNSRHTGIGSKLLNFCLKNIIDDKKCFLEVNASNEVAREFYIKNKFLFILTRKKYYNNKHDALIFCYKK